MTSAHAADERAHPAIERLAVFGGLPLLVTVVYGNLSDLAIRNLSTPSLVQPMVGVLIVAVILLRRKLIPSTVVVSPMVFFFAGYCVVVMASSNWADIPSQSDARTQEIFKDLVIMVVAAILAASWQALKVVMACIVGTATFLATLSIVQLVTGTDNEFFGLATLKSASVVGNVFQPRASGPLDEPNFYGQMLVVAIPLAAVLAWTARKRWQRAGYVAAAFVIAGGVGVTYSRGAMVSLAAMMALAALLLRVRPMHVVSVAIAGALLFLALPDNVTKRLLTVEDLLPQKNAIQEKDASIEKRKLLLAVGLRMFADHPLAGVGAGNFYRHFAHYAYQVGSSSPQYEDPSQEELPHSLYFEIATETGLLGLTMFFGAIAATFVALQRARRNSTGEPLALATAVEIALFGYLVSSIFLHSGYQRTFWILIALAASVSKLNRFDRAAVDASSLASLLPVEVPA